MWLIIFVFCVKYYYSIYYHYLECGRTYQENSATFSTPSYLGKIGPEEGEKCEWRITATHGEKIVLNITELDIAKSPDCKTDFIEIRDGYWQKSELLGRFCGTGKIDSIISVGSRMLVTYVARNPNGHRGFQANYEGNNFRNFISQLIWVVLKILGGYLPRFFNLHRPAPLRHNFGYIIIKCPRMFLI